MITKENNMLNVFFKNFFKKDKEGELKFIKQCPLFSKLTNREVKFLQKILHRRIYTDGEIIFKPASGTGMHIILKGQVNILHGTPSSQEEPSLVSSLKSGDFFGELALLKNGAYQSMFAQSLNNSHLLSFYQPDLNFIIKNKPKIGIVILRELANILSHRLSKAEQKILQVHSQK